MKSSNVLPWFCLIIALVVRFLTRRFIGDYERNAGELVDVDSD